MPQFPRREWIMVGASILAIFAGRGVLRPPLGAGGLYDAAISTALLASLAMLLLAGSGLPYLRRNFRRMLKAATWVSLTAFVFSNAAVATDRAVAGSPGLFSVGMVGSAALFGIFMATIFVVGEV